MRFTIAILAALLCASCGGGSSAGSAADPAAAASSMPMTTSAQAADSPAPAPPSTSTSSSSSSTPSSSPSTPPAATTQSSAPPPPPFYKVVEIPRLAATGSVTANGINDQGVVVGQQETTASPRAWMYQQSSGALNELTLDPAESGAYANGISDSGVIAGAEVPDGPPAPGFWTVTGGAMLLTGQFDSSAEAVAANDAGTIIGNYGEPGTTQSQPLVWTAPAYAETTLGGLQCDQCTRIDVTASAVNSGGLIVGSSSYSISNSDGSLASGMHAVAWTDGTIADLGGLQGANYSAAYSVNTGGDIVGGSRTARSPGAATHAFLYHQGVMSDLGTLSGDSSSSANSINDSGQIVGISQSDTSSRAFLYENGRMYDLNTLLDPSRPLVGVVSLQEAVAISSNGWIAVNGTDSNDPGWQRAFLLIPSG